MDQEFGLIIGRSGAKKDFITEWLKYVPAIISYGEHSRKRAIANVLLDLDLTGKWASLDPCTTLLPTLICGHPCIKASLQGMLLTSEVRPPL